MNSKLGVRRTPTPAPHSQPLWYTDVQTARQTARDQARPCVLILNADSSAL
jgi:hypothetical protein